MMNSSSIWLLFQQAKQMVAVNSSKKLSAEEVSKIEDQASKSWDKFYGIHQVINEISVSLWVEILRQEFTAIKLLQVM